MRLAILLASCAVAAAAEFGCECAGYDCGPCAPAITIVVGGATDAEVVQTAGVPLTFECHAGDASAICTSTTSVAPGSYTFHTRDLAGATSPPLDFDIVPDTGKCCRCGYAPQTRTTTVARDGGPADAG